MTSARFRLAVFATWLLACAILLWIARDRIAGLTMWDPDDYLRLQQVRDLLAGQSFFDVAQYRIDPPHGVPMHWSRIVDLPIAGLILLLRPLLGGVFAERAAASAVPLLILGGELAALALIGTRLADRRTALLAAMLASAAPLMLFHVMPLRIDHHGIQTMLGLFAIGACFDPRPVRGGLLAGALAAVWLAVSLEALPMVTAIAALLGLRFIVEGEAAAIHFRGYCAALAAGGVALFAAFHGPTAYAQPYCDAVSPAWFGPMVVSPALVAILLPRAARRGAGVRIALLAASGAAGVALLALTAPACLHGPFAALDPLVRHYWYDNVMEGLPVWKQSPDNASLLVGFPLVGFAGTLLGWRRAATAEAASNWLMMLALLACAFTLGLLVQRAGAFAHGCALPGAAFLLTRLLDAIGRWRHAVLRIFASTLAIAGLSPVGAMVVGDLLLTKADQGRDAAPQPAPGRKGGRQFEALARLRRATILAGLDPTPELLVKTPHSYAGSGHHRDPQAIRRVIISFLGQPEVAHRIMAERGIGYVLVDPDGNEATIYGKAAPHGLMADLLADMAPAWLKPVALPGSSLRLWKRVA